MRPNRLHRIAAAAVARAQPASWALLSLGVAAFLLLPLAGKKCYLDEKALLVGGAVPTIRWATERGHQNSALLAVGPACRACVLALLHVTCFQSLRSWADKAALLAPAWQPTSRHCLQPPAATLLPRWRHLAHRWLPLCTLGKP